MDLFNLSRKITRFKSKFCHIPSCHTFPICYCLSSIHSTLYILNYWKRPYINYKKQEQNLRRTFAFVVWRLIGVRTERRDTMQAANKYIQYELPILLLQCRDSSVLHHAWFMCYRASFKATSEHKIAW